MLGAHRLILTCALGALPLVEAVGAPLTLADVAGAARANRAEIVAARARAEALAQRPAIVSALEDPMISPSIDHYPFETMEDEQNARRYDWSIGFEQRIPLSAIRKQRERAARAEAARANAETDAAALDVIGEAQEAFFMLRERRLMVAVLTEQLQLARQLVAAAAARYASGSGAQVDVLLAELEQSRLEAAQRALDMRIVAAEAMLNVSMGLDASAPVGELDYAVSYPPLPKVADLQNLADRPELRVGAAEIERAAAESDVMRSMYRPMATVRLGRASTMAEGNGAMLMFGVSVPLWRGRLRAGVAEAEAMERMARADLVAMERMVVGEIAAARAEVEATRESLTALEKEVVPRARITVDAALAAYSAGQGTLVLVVDASRALWQVETERVMAETQTSQAWTRLQIALGRTEVGEVTP